MTKHGSWLLTLALAACGTLEGADYRGEPIAQLGGTMTSARATDPRDLAAAIVWMPYLDEPVGFGNAGLGASFGRLLDIEGNFPASFHIPLYATPSDAEMRGVGFVLPDDGTPLGWGVMFGKIVVVDRTHVTDNGNGTFDMRDALVGSTDALDDMYWPGKVQATEVQLMYVTADADVEPEILAGEPIYQRGYHLFASDVFGTIACGDAAKCEQDLLADPWTAMFPAAFIEGYCHAPHADVQFSQVPLDTELHVTVSDEPLYIDERPNGGLYDRSKVPTCP